MTTDKGIFIQNIYYMLSYAYQVLQQQDYQCIASEKFEHIDDLFAAILAKGVSRQLKQGLYREYVSRSETRSVLRGKLDLPQTIKTRIQHKPQVACTFDELSEDNLYNQILKTTLQVLLRDENVSAARKVELKKVLLFLDTVSVLLPSQIPWKQLHYQRSNQNYEMLLNLCYFVLHDMLQTTENGSYKMTAFSDERMAKLYERFILEYYRKHHTYLTEVKAAQVKWDLVGEHDAAMLRFLPAMQTDIFLRFHEKILILDAKYYSQTLQQQFHKETLHSANLYQIYTYVKNQDAAHTGTFPGCWFTPKRRKPSPRIACSTWAATRSVHAPWISIRTSGRSPHNWMELPSSFSGSIRFDIFHVDLPHVLSSGGHFLLRRS